MSRLLFSGARLLCPYNGLDSVGDVLLEDGRIVQVRLGGGLDVESAERLDCRGLVLAPGFVDLHTHLREPGEEHKETIATGARAALAGGFTTLCAMPNTRPALDSRTAIEMVRERAEGVGVSVLPIGAITKGRAGDVLAPHRSMADAGAVAFSDDGSPVSDSGMMRRALEYSEPTGLPIVSHCEEYALSRGGAMHEGAVSARLGLPGAPASAEEVMVRRDVALARETGGRLHVAHLSTSGAVDAVREARARGLAVTAEVTPHHLLLTDEWVAGWGKLDGAGRDRSRLGATAYDTSTKVNPPLRSEEHVRAVLEGVQDGTIDAIATDHAPHSSLDKDCEYGCAAFGISGLETALGLLLHLVHRGDLALERLVSLLTLGPSRTFGLSADGIREGAAARLTLFDPELEWIVDGEQLLSKGKNTPLHGHRLRGKVWMTIAGDRTYRSNELEAR
ncbi:MAG: dihydroorotase [Chloroflexota bacterium]|nr:dihydroorotase [Chloroflexota bacterium]